MSKVQFNLLPDVKIEFMKAQTTKKLVMTIAFIVSGTALAIFLILFFTVNIVQKKQLSDADAKIKDKSAEFSKIEDLDKAFIIQNQLNTLSELHGSKHINSRLFGYLPQITPTNVTISKVEVDHQSTSLKITGNADSQRTVNTFVDTMKFTKFRVGDEENSHPAFASVVESSFTLSGAGVNFVLDATFDKALFENKIDENGDVQIPKLEVPKLTTTRSFLESSGNPLFKELIQDKQPTATGGTPQ